MSITTECERDNICVMTIRRTLRKQDLDASEQALIDAMGQTGTVRLLVILDGFEGWERGGDWGTCRSTSRTATASTASRLSAPSGGTAKA
jgi:hypothetical protein